MKLNSPGTCEAWYQQPKLADIHHAKLNTMVDAVAFRCGVTLDPQRALRAGLAVLAWGIHGFLR